MTNIEINGAAIVAGLREQARTRQFTEADDVQYFSQYPQLDPQITVRILIERAVIRCAVTSILAIQAEEGPAYTISVFDGEDTPLPHSRDVGAIMNEICACDEETLVVRRAPKPGDDRRPYVGKIILVYGNDGWDVIADNSLSLEAMLEGATKLAEALGDAL